MFDDRQIKHAWYLLLIISALFFLSRFIGGMFFDNNWSFTHFRHLSSWYPALWALLSAGIIIFVLRYQLLSGYTFAGRPATIIASIVLFALLLLFRHDSFILGGGNLKVGMVDHVPSSLFRWHELGGTLLASWVRDLLAWFDLPRSTPAVLGWTTISFLATLAALVGCIRLSRMLSDDPARRTALFIIMFFGPQAAIWFGYIGVEPIFAAAATWLALFVLKTDRDGGIGNLALIWLIALLGIFLYFRTIFLLPAVLFVTIRKSGSRSGKIPVVSIGAGLFTYLLVIGLYYYKAATDFEFSHHLLFLNARPPFGNLSLFSLRHIGDIVQIFFLVVPTIAVTKYLWIGRLSDIRQDGALFGFSLMALGGGTALFVTNPFNGIVFDMPGMSAFLAPLALLTGLVLSRLPKENNIAKRILGLMAAMAVIVPLSYLPVVLRIDRMETYAREYLDKNNLYYLNAGFAFRDAYFYLRYRDDRKEVLRVPGFENLNPGQKTVLGELPATGDKPPVIPMDTTNLEKANHWEWIMPTVSEDYLNLSGASDLIAGKRYDDALRYLYAMKHKRPYWTDARLTLVNLLIGMRRYPQVRPELDTLLMLEPYRREVLMNEYIFWRDQNKLVKAMKAVRYAAAMFPDDKEIITDLMIINQRIGNTAEASRLADSLTAVDSTLPYPYLIYAFQADASKDYRTAVRYYEQFISLAPDEPEVERMRRRLNELADSLKQQP